MNLHTREQGGGTLTAPFEPSHPTALAAALLVVWVAILSIPMLAGRFLGNQFNDQVIAGYAFRVWGAHHWRALGHVPLWNPELLGGLPFVGAMHGDIFYPTAWFRLFLPTALVMNLEFPVHYVLAGLFTYALLRRLKASWSGAVVGGLAYQLSGVIVSYVAPGHDGKLFVTTMLPLVLLGLVMGMRERRYEAYAIVAIGVGLALISPQAQCTYYMLVAAGIFALYLTFGERDDRTPRERWSALGFALVAVVVGFGIGMIQILPFYQYTPFSPRGGTSVNGYAWSTSYAIPWAHIPELFLSGFTGRTEVHTYWGPNFLKLHSEYLGLPVLALAFVGLGDRTRRRLIYWLGGIGALFLLVGMGGDTPFYRLWWSVMPFMKKVRSPGMALYVVALITAAFAAFGVERLERGEGRKAALGWLIGGLVVALLAVAGVFGAVAEGLAQGVALPGAQQAASAAQNGIRFGALGSGVALALLGLLLFALARGRLTLRVFAIAVPLLVGADLWRAGRPFWMYEAPPTSSTYALDPVTTYLTDTARTTPEARYPGRVLDVGGYGGSVLMAFNIPQVQGYHSNEIHEYDVLLDRNHNFRNRASPRIWDLLAVRYIINNSQASGAPDSIFRGYHERLTNVQTSTGNTVSLLEADSAPPYARLVPAAIKLEDAQAVPTIVDPRTAFDPDRIVLLGPEASVEPPRITALPPAPNVRVQVTQWGVEHMTLKLAPAAPVDGYVVVAENYYPNWHATVDGKAAPVLRGDVSLITVPVKAGARTVDLQYVSASYRRGKGLTLFSAGLAFLGLIVPPVLRRRRA